MHPLSRFRAVTIIALLSLGAGCQSAPAAPSAGAPVAAPARTARGACDNPFFPLQVGYAASYTMTGSSGPMPYSMSVSDAGQNTVTMEYEIRNGTTLKMKQDFSCQGGDINALTYLDMSSVVSGVELSTKTIKATGLVLPANLAVGSEWDNTYEFEATMNNPQLQKMGLGKTTGITTTHNKALREERVTVAAGSYDALVVESVVNSDALIGKTRSTMTTTSTQWWVKGVGLVKTASDKVVTSELQSVTLP